MVALGRASLGPIETRLRLVMASLEDSNSSDPAVQIARRNADRLRELVDQLFDVVRLDAGRLAVRARRLDSSTFLRDLIGRFAPIATARSLTLLLHDEHPAVELWADPDLLEKALANLLTNAIKFTPSGGTVAVRTALGVEGLRIRVEDDGPGVAVEVSDRIFERYYQADSGDDRAAEGAGIGLSLARELAELQGGSLRLVDHAGVGAVFELSLPVGIEHLAIGDITLEGGTGEVLELPSQAATGRVLVVEDHGELRAYLSARIGSEYAVDAVADGHAALERVRQGGIDLVLSDIMMPGMDGLSLCRHLRADPALAALPVVLLSAKGAGAKVEALAAGATIYLPKPVLTSALMAALRRLLPPRPAEVDDAPADPPSDVAPVPQAPPDLSAPVDAPSPSQGGLSVADRALLERIEGIARAELHNTAFSAETLAAKMAMSPRSLQRCLNRLVQKAPAAYLQELRLELGRNKLLDGISVSEAAAAVGMSPSYFSRVYSAWYGYRPSKESPRIPN